MTTLEIKQLPVDEKLRIMEIIWEDFRERFESSELPQSYRDLLDARRKRVETGESELLDWDVVKSTVGRE